jgi:hypothetical protein
MSKMRISVMNHPFTVVPTSSGLFAAAERRVPNRGVEDEVPMNKEVSKLLTAAVVSRTFCQLLLTNPAQALEDGYNGMRFALTNQEKELLLSIRASSLPELASQISSSRNGHGMGQTTPIASPLLQV